MNVKLKKISIVKPKVNIKTGFRTIARETYKDNNVPFNTIFAFDILFGIIGNVTMEEI